MALHPDPCRPGSGPVRADALEASTAGVSLTTTVTRAVAITATYTGIGMPSQSPPPSLARRAVVVRRDAGRVPEHGAVEQRVRPERRDDRVEPHPADQEPVQQAGDDRGEERDADRRQEPRVDAGRVLGEDHDVERKPAGHREVDAALHDDERLAERGDRERRRERQHRQQHASAEARRREQPGSPTNSADRGHEHGRETAREQASATRAGQRFRDSSEPARCVSGSRGRRY